MVGEWALLVLFAVAVGQNEAITSQSRPEHRGETCDCLEYWACISGGGQPYSYCGLTESMVCCLLPPEKETTVKPKCGIKGFDSGLVGVSEPAEWPWHVAVVEEPGFFYVCSGSLIDEYWVLTAAHCVASPSNGTTRFKVRLGEHDVAANIEALPHEDKSVINVVVHPKFDENTLQNDIALLRLETAVRQRHHIDVVCLPTEQNPLEDSCILTGWGKTTQGGGFSQVLKEVPIPLWKTIDCETALRKEFGSSFQLQNNTICAGASGRDACDGDGGGPLVCKVDGQWTQHGIVSYGFGCGERGVPGVYTKVSDFKRWIQSTINGKS